MKNTLNTNIEKRQLNIAGYSIVFCTVWYGPFKDIYLTVDQGKRCQIIEEIRHQQFMDTFNKLGFYTKEEKHYWRLLINMSS